MSWNLRGEAPPAQDARGSAGAPGGAAGPQRGGGFGGRGGPQQGPLVAPGRYRAALGTLTGETVTPLGQPQVFTVVQIQQ